MGSKLWPLWAICVCCLISVTAYGQDGHDHDSSKPDSRISDLERSSAYQEGLRSNSPRRSAIVNAWVVRSADQNPVKETILINGSKIESVGADLELPAGTKIIDAKGKYIYPGLIDSYWGGEFENSDSGTRYWNSNVQPELKVSEAFDPGKISFSSRRKNGFTSALVAPTSGVISGQSSLVLLSDFESEHLMLKTEIAQHLRLTLARRGRGSGYPNSPMGAVALARQAMYDGQWYEKAWKAVRADSSIERPETNQSLNALSDALNGSQPVVVETSNELFVGRAGRFAREFGLNLIILGSGNEYRRLQDLAELGRPVILPVNFPKAPDVSSAELAEDVSLEDMMHWDHAPENPKRLAEANIEFVFTTKGLTDIAEFLGNVRTAVKRGLAKEKALAAMTSGPAELFGVSDQIGAISKGMIANLTICDGDLFSDKTKITETWVDGRRFENSPAPLRENKGQWKLIGKRLAGKTLVVKGSSAELVESDGPGKTSKQDAEESDAIKVRNFSQNGTRMTGAFRSDSIGADGISMFSLVVSNEGTAAGKITFPDGSKAPLSAKIEPENKQDTPEDRQWDQIAEETNQLQGKNHKHTDGLAKTCRSAKPATYPVNYPLGAFGRNSIPKQPKSVLIKNVTVWTLDERGKIENGAVLFGDGWIRSVFTEDEQLPTADVVIDGKGGHVTPGIIDCHSHMATDSGVNESGQAITAEVRIGDMIDCDDVNIYRQLAGGVTTSNILHGSANPIGGQNQVIKLRWGANEEQMKLADAPAGIKFALGENVKQSNWSNPTNRYPQTRMGVEQLIDDALRAAIDYRTDWANWQKDKKGLPPRVDLELEALKEIVEKERWIHCHSYRQDEILALMRVLESHDITIGSFQHILEGYKVAEEMARHGAMASAFADWWAYKYEVKDAIPYAGALMHRAGVVVSFNSDDRELARHLNHEAAKAVKYGGVPEVEALKFVTLNPARQLRIEERVGSIEAGKDADIVLWSSHPLSNMAVVQQTWVDGRKYFDIEEDRVLQDEARTQRLALIQKILESGEEMERPNRENTDPAKLWPRFDEFCHGHDHAGHGH